MLVVDDDPLVLERITRLLAREGYLVAAAPDGEEGWSILERGGIQLLITDNAMPRLSGVGLIARARAAGFTVPAVLVSGSLPWDPPAVPPELLPLALLQKPHGCDDLLRAVGAATAAGAASPRGESPAGGGSGAAPEDAGARFLPPPWHPQRLDGVAGM